LGQSPSIASPVPNSAPQLEQFWTLAIVIA